MLFITHALPRSLRVDEVVRIGAERVTVLSGERAGAASQERAAPAPA